MRGYGALLLAALTWVSWGQQPAMAEGLDTEAVIAAELGLSGSDASAYWDGVSYTIVSLVAGGQRVALDGLGAFEPSYVSSESGEVLRSMKFSFDLGPAVEQPCVKTAFDEDVLKSLQSFAWVKPVGAALQKRITGDEWQKLLDLFVFAVLRNIDGHTRQPLGMGLGHFFPTVDVDLSTERDANQRRLVVDFVADDDSPEKFAYQYNLSIDALDKMLMVLQRETNNLYRYARVTGISDYSTAAAQVAAVAEDFAAELDDLSGTRAQDHNSSRSNKTASVISGGVDELGDAQETLKKAAAQDHNSSRSNKTASAISNVEDGGGWASETLNQKAQDHNSSRSNKTASKSADFYNDLLHRYDGAYNTKAQDHNSSRSNKTASVIADFDPSPELEALFARIATF